MPTAAEILFPNAAPDAPAAQPTPVAQSQPAAPAVAPQPAQAEESAEARFEKLFANPDSQAKAPAGAEAQPPANPAAIPDFIDQAHPDASVATPIVQELGLGREQVAKLETLHQQMSAAAIERQAATWATEAERLPPQDIRDAKAAVAQFGTPELKAVLNQTGLGNHPAIIQAFAKALRSNPYRR